MNRIGIVGGIGPETTVEYYRRIIALYRQRNPDGSAPYIIINSLDLKKPLEYAFVLGMLLMYRVVSWVVGRKAVPKPVVDAEAQMTAL